MHGVERKRLAQTKFFPNIGHIPAAFFTTRKNVNAQAWRRRHGGSRNRMDDQNDQLYECRRLAAWSKLLEIAKPAAVDAIGLACVSAGIVHATGFEHRAQAFGHPARRRRPAIMNAGVEGGLMRGFVNGGGNVLLRLSIVGVAIANTYRATRFVRGE